MGRLLGQGRAGWLADVATLTRPARERRAAALEARGRAVAGQHRREWVTAESACDGPAGGVPGGVARSHRGKPLDGPLEIWPWHASRAEGKRTLFARVDDCKNERRALRLTCKGCGHSPELVPIGCDVAMFCPQCRTRQARKFRLDFERKRQGLLGVAWRAGVAGDEARYRRRELGGRFGERMVTLTVPHVGNARERIALLDPAFARFWRIVSDKLRPRLSELRSGVVRVDEETGEVRYHVKRGRNAERARQAASITSDELTLWDLVSYLWVREWTPGADGLGHPHIHVWLFSPFVAHAALQEAWATALADVLGGRWERRTDQGGRERAWVMAPGVEDFAPVVDVRGAHDVDEGSFASELVKYLTKEWERSSDGVYRARADVFAEVFLATDGRRQRQSSAGLASYAVAKFCACEACGHTAELGHWARVELELAAERDARLRRASIRKVERGPPRVPGDWPSSAVLRSRLKGLHDAARDAEWEESALAPLRELEAAIRNVEGLEEQKRCDVERDARWASSPELWALQRRLAT